MQGGGEEALIKISLALKIPILSSNKNGIVAGSAFGPVADFRTLGRISGEMAARILKGEASPSSLSSEFQEPPSIIANRKSLERLGIEVPASIQISFVDE
jgi:putative ABC transport system substrate-binding protein